jgi:hypothetical protein
VRFVFIFQIVILFSSDGFVEAGKPLPRFFSSKLHHPACITPPGK